MESQEDRESKGRMKRTGTIVIVIVVLVGLALAYQNGLIPGIGSGSETAAELKKDIEALKGDGIQKKILAGYQNAPNAANKEKTALEKFLTENASISLDYAGLKTSSGEGRGIVTLTAPKL